MARLRSIFLCGSCGAQHPKWAGKCDACGEWNSIIEDVEGPDPAPHAAALVPGGTARPINALDAPSDPPTPTHMPELDRVLGGGLVAGSVTLLGGEPGIGKSTLLLQLLAAWSSRSLYVTAEESTEQVGLRAGRLGALRDDLWLLSESSMANVVRVLDAVEPTLLVVDSIQAVADPSLPSLPGSVNQVRGCAHRLVHEAKSRGIPTVIVGHVTKEGSLAGPRLLEHVVDTVLSFEGDRHHALRLLRAVKHRFGSTSELGLFEMTEQGLQGVPDASSLFLADRRTGTPGSVVVPAIEGHRPMLVEVQALTNPSGVPARRSAQGLDPSRLAMLIAVLERRAGVTLAQHEVYASVAGGVRLAEPGSDLGVLLAIASAALDAPVHGDLVVTGEVGLGGEVRQIGHLERRLAEAGRLGFRRALVPANASVRTDASITAVPVATIAEALAAAGISRTH
ncbi:MAG: DNA repair protein RadA [Acidobacteria bacterium]|nr:DNA repair protein RadA [Acidobacteriota bacterium]